MLCFWSGVFIPVSIGREEICYKTGSLPWPHRESIAAPRQKVEIYILNILCRSRLSWDRLRRPKPRLDFGYLCGRYLLNQNLIQRRVWYTERMPSWKQLVAICLRNPITSPSWARFCRRDLSCEVHGMSFVDTCVIAAGSGPTKGILDVVSEGGWLEIFSWNGLPLENVSFSKPKLFVGTHVPHATKMVFLVTVGKRGNKDKHRKEGEKFFTIPELEGWVLMILTWDAEVLFQ